MFLKEIEKTKNSWTFYKILYRMQQEGFCRNVVLLVIADLPDREVCVTVLFYLRGKTVEDLIQSCSLGRMQKVSV